MKKLMLALFFVPIAPSFATPPSEAANEILYLMGYLKESGCQFNRNGSWYTADEAVDHLKKKYEYLSKKGQVDSAEEFITRGASESSMSGKPYQVKCGAEVPVPSGLWLTTELNRYRHQSKNDSSNFPLSGDQGPRQP